MKEFSTLPFMFDHSGSTISDGANKVKLINYKGHQLVVKSYKQIKGLANLIYRFRRPKAFHAYKHALMLLDLGIPTPEPAGFVITYDLAGVPSKSFYIAEYSDWKPLSMFIDTEEGFDRDIVGRFAEFVAQLHGKQVNIKDLDSSHVLVGEDGRFQLIHLEKVSFKRLKYNDRLKNLAQFSWKNRMAYEFFIEKYVEASARLLPYTSNEVISTILKAYKKQNK